MLATAIAHSGPVSLRYPRGTGWGVHIDSEWPMLPIGKAEVLTHGDDVLILAIGRTVGEALLAQEILLKEDISATLVNARFVKPMDIDTICSLAKKIPRIVTVEENVLQGGFGSAVLECLNDNDVTGYRLTRLGISDTFVEHGSQSMLRSKYGIDAQAIAQAVRRLQAV
jgi:1-deoxy-D-xylulose-5-phosphate synthase